MSSYQGGHNEYFRYLVDLLRARGGERIKVFGGGVIVPEEIVALEQYGVEKIYSPHDGQRLGLQGMIDDMIGRCSSVGRETSAAHTGALGEWIDGLTARPVSRQFAGEEGQTDDATALAFRRLAQLISAFESGGVGAAERDKVSTLAHAAQIPVLGITGTGGAGKSSLTDELIRRFRLDYGDALTIAVLAIDPSRRKSGGALLGDRIRMNAIGDWGGGARVYMRSMATREASSEISNALPDALMLCKAAGFDLIVVETSGIGQGDAAIVPFVDESLYVMTPEFGAASQLEKIDMLDFADFVAINKFDRKGAADALRDVAKQVQRNRGDFAKSPDAMPVFGTIASRFNDDGVTALYRYIANALHSHGLRAGGGRLAAHADVRFSSGRHAIVPPARVRYLAEIAQTVHAYRERAKAQACIARERWQLVEARRMLGEARADESGASAEPSSATQLDALIAQRTAALGERERQLLDAGRQPSLPIPATNTWSASATARFARRLRSRLYRARRYARSRCPGSSITARFCAG
ncbi:MAG: B12 binding domain / kinase domain / Methylmalonyl-CoA mutase (EC [uncultured Paraburkholderia sp.]|nr:MAG: B12 binding domain / kinase domain / Methylmalonyl-CoA mutase (EC [uncultured Paraburkholderia sp.]